MAAGDVKPSPWRYRINGKPEPGFGRLKEIFQNPDGKQKKREISAKEQWASAIKDFHPDLIWVHNLAGAVKWGWSLDMVEIALHSAPVLWTLHDMWALGDGPAYLSEEKLAIESMDSPVRHFKNDRRIEWTAPSRWLCDLVQHIAPVKCTHLPYVLDTMTFSSAHREKTREKLHLRPQEAFLLLAAENLEDSRKGVDLFCSAWESIAATKHRCSFKIGFLGRNPPIHQGEKNFIPLGSLEKEIDRAKIFSAADLLIHPARQDNAPLVISEALACGTPVLAFSVGGIPEMIVDQVNGFLCGQPSAKGITESLLWVDRHPEKLRSMRPICRQMMIQNQERERQTEQIHGILQKCLSREILSKGS